MPHLAVALDRTTWAATAVRLQDADVEFLIEPHVRFQGLAGEQATMLFLDPSGNALKFKALNDVTSMLFST